MKEENAMGRREYAVGGKARNCYVCGRELKAHDVKVVMPSKALGADRLSIDRRMLCSNCYYSLIHKIPAVQGGLKKAIVAKGRKLLIKEFRA